MHGSALFRGIARRGIERIPTYACRNIQPPNRRLGLGAGMAQTGLVHLYWGDGKGKTTAAMGLALRALGHGQRVVIVQFLKDGASGELEGLRRLGAVVLSGPAGLPFVFQMTTEERAAARAAMDEYLRQALALPCDLLVLDEACAAWELEMVDPDALQSAVLERPAGREVVLTGRSPAPWMQEAADYSTEMRCHRHPFDKGTPARVGVEY